MNHVGDINIDDKLRKASAEAAQLKAHLAAATNMKTGALDFTKLNRSLKDSGVSLQHYGETLRAMGPEGQKAFSQLARAVAQSEVPIRRTNKLVKEMSTTLKNSLRWQLSSSILHGFMTSMSDAYNYAKNLNSALTDIRIVSGQSADQMARFAKQANIAAKDLSTTTQEYAKAALIYYQQGLKQQEVTERTEVTVKMANVTGDAAQDVSSYMTAIWNNFNKAGDESVEHFADIMTKLGAATAASTSEIAAGLSKFSAVADTIGLSFEMATSAVTAIVDQTRETPEVVGTALKTIFSRIEGLQQGETMEDGVNLNKYSKGLQKVGVDIMNANGQLKDADQILKEIGDKWETLDKNQQVALAQTTAGIRQYNQFMALFDNWDKVEQNLTLAATAEGTLDQQAEIYAESWEAASNRVRASLEGLFDSLLEDDFFIGLLNGFSELIGFIEGTVDALGGMKGVLLAIGAILTKVFSSQMAGGLRNMAENIQMMTPKGRQKVIDEKREQLEALSNARYDGNAGYGDREGASREKSIKASVGLQDKFIQNESRMNDIEKDTVRALIDKHDSYSDKAAESAREADEAKAVQDATRDRLRDEIIDSSINNGEIDYEEIKRREQKLNDAMNKVNSDAQSKLKVQDILNDIDQKGEFTQEHLDELSKAVNDIDPSGVSDLTKMLPDVSKGAEEAKTAIRAMGKELESVAQMNAEEAFKEVEDDEENIKKIVSDANERASKEKKSKEDEQQRQEVEREVQDQIDNAQGVKATAADGIISIANAASNAMMVVTMLSSAIDTLKSPDASGWDKFLAIIGALSVAIPVLTSSFTMLSSAESIAGVEALANAVAQKVNTIETLKNADAQRVQAAAIRDSGEAMNEDKVATSKNSQQSTLNTLTQLQGKQKGTNKIFGAGTSILGRYGKALGTIVSKLGPYGLAIGAIAVGIWGLVKAWNADKDAAEKAAKAAQDATEAYEVAIQKQSEITSTLDSYTQASQSLDELTEGTWDWVQALNNANSAVLTLLETYPELAQYITNVDGKLEISPSGIDYILEQSQKQVDTAYRTSLFASQAKADAEIRSQKTDLKRDIGIDERTINTLLEAIDTYGSGFLSDKEAIKEIVGVNNLIADNIMENSSGILELSSEIAMNSKQSETFAKQIASMALKDVEGYSTATDEEKALAEEMYAEEYSKRVQNLYDNQYSKLNDSTLREQYMEAIGAADYEKVDGDTAKYLDKAGEEIDTVSDSTAAMYLAELDATESMGSFTAEIFNTISALIAFQNELLGDNKDTMDENVADTFSNRDDKGNFDFSNLTKEQVYDAIMRTGGKAENDWDLSSVDYESMGYDTFEAFKEDYHQQLIDYYNSLIEQEELKNQYVNEITDKYRAQSTEEKTEQSKSTTAPQTWQNTPEAFQQSLFPENYDATESQELFQGAMNNSYTKQTQTNTDNYDHQDPYKEQLAINEERFWNSLEAAFQDKNDSLYGTPEDYEALLETHGDSINKYLEAGIPYDQILEGLRQENGMNSEEQSINSLISTENLDLAEVEEYGEYLQEIAEVSDEIDDSLGDDPIGAKKIAANLKATDKELKNINKVLEEYQEIIEDTGNKSMPEYQKGMDQMRTAVADYFEVEEELIDDSFLEEHMDNLIDGSEEAMLEVGNDLAKKDLAIEAEMNVDLADSLPDINSALDKLTELAPDLDLGGTVDIDTSPALAAMADIVNQGGAAADAAIDALAEIGYEPEFETVEVQDQGNIPNGSATATVTNSGDWVDTAVIGDQSFTFTLPQPKYTFKGNENGGTPIENTMPITGFKGKPRGGAARGGSSKQIVTGFKKVSNLGGSGGGKKGGSGGGGGGGGGSKASRIKKTKKPDVVKRYKAVTDDLQDVTRAQDKAAKSAERLYGTNRINAMKEVNKLLEREIQMLQERKLSEASGYLEEDKKELLRVWKSLNDEFGMGLPGLIFDSNGNIDNYKEVMETIWSQIDAIQSKYGDETEIDETIQKQIDDLTERAKRLEEVIGQYDETLNLVEEINDEIEEKQREIQDRNYEMITYKLEFEIEINDAELEKIDYFFNKTQKDNIYDMAEGLMIYGKRWEELSDSAGHYINTYNELQKQFEEGKISEDHLIEGQKEAISNLIENAEQMQEFLEYVTHEYYKETLEMGIEEIDKYAEGFDRLSDAVDHYMNIASTLGKETDYEYIEKFLNTNIDNINNKLAASTDKYNMLLEQRNYWEAELGKYEYGSTEYEQVKKNLEATNEAVEEAYDERLSIVEEKAEAIRALIENKMAQAAKSFENALTDGSGFDSYMSQFEKLNSRQEEYLTKTNQIYETNKLMRQAAQAADKTDNEVAKRKFKNFENETKKLQENAKLSNYELEIQQAKYDLLLAEIALEEAQNAKSTVRLQRDNEGNFGYVYTANKDEIADAQQQYEDAQNALYNISLQGQQDYTAKYLESLQMMYDEIQELDTRHLEAGTQNTEQYYREREAIEDHYFNPEYGVLAQYSNLYNVAVQTDARATEDYWGKSYGNMTARTEEWKTAVNNYVAEVQSAFGLWTSAQTELNNNLNGTLEDNAKFTKDVKDKSEDLADTITTTVIPAVEEEIESVKALTQEWINDIKAMEEVIAKSEEIFKLKNKENNEEEKNSKTWDAYGKDFDFMREAIRIGLGKGTTDMKSVDEALAYREQKLLDNVNNKELLDLAGLGQYLGDEEGLRAAVAIQHDNVRNSIARAGYDHSTNSYLNSIADDPTKGYSYKDIYEKYTDLSVDMLLLASKDEKYKNYASYETYDKAADQRRAKIKQLGLSDWEWKKFEILFERANHEPKLAAYLETLRQKVVNGIYPDIRPESEAGIPWDLSAAINQYIQSGGKSDNLGYIKSSADLQMALDSRAKTISADRIEDLGIASNKDTFNESELKRYGAHFDTGGYTGSWGPEGKLAMLHQKELILNASDTENMLKMIEIVRDLSQQIDMFAASQALRGALFSSPSYLTGQNGTLEQNVHIEASFPGVTDRNQIEEAFGDLINVAYQYAHRK